MTTPLRMEIIYAEGAFPILVEGTPVDAAEDEEAAVTVACSRAGWRLVRSASRIPSAKRWWIHEEGGLMSTIGRGDTPTEALEEARKAKKTPRRKRP